MTELEDIAAHIAAGGRGDVKVSDDLAASLLGVSIANAVIMTAAGDSEAEAAATSVNGIIITSGAIARAFMRTGLERDASNMIAKVITAVVAGAVRTLHEYQTQMTERARASSRTKGP